MYAWSRPIRDHDGKTRHRTVINLGRRDLLATHLDLGKLDAGCCTAMSPPIMAASRARTLRAVGAWDWGPMLATRAMWSELGLDTMLDQLARPDRRDAVRLSDRALVLVANRLAAPGSEHALAQWLETDFVCDRRGRRFVAAWRDAAERRASRAPRVRVEARQLQQWYRTLDQLLALQATGRARAVRAAARPVLVAGRHGVLRSDVELLRGRRPGRRRAPTATAVTTSRATRRYWSA